jgi:hypothetical protein
MAVKMVKEAQSCLSGNNLGKLPKIIEGFDVLKYS